MSELNSVVTVLLCTQQRDYTTLKYIIDIANTKLTKVKNSQRVLQEEASPHMTWLWHLDSQKPLQ